MAPKALAFRWQLFMTNDQPEHARPAEKSTTGQQPDSGEVDGEYWRWCPRCGHELHNEKCKLTCPRCFYFMSCSDFD